jgi:hypothetical protein
MGSPLQNLIDIDNNFLGSLDLDQLRIPSKDLSGPGRIYEPNIPQTGVSTSSLPEMRRKLDRSTISNDLSRRKRLLSGNSAKSHPRTGSRFNEKVSNLNNSADNNSAVLVIAEDTNDTQPEVQIFLAEANQQSKPPKAGSSRNSPSRKVATTWEHTFVVQKEFTEAASESPPERTSLNLGRRRRPLSEDIRKRAKEMRKTRSCLRCKVSKIAVCCKIWPKGIIC